jgi:hypothetical protein
MRFDTKQLIERLTLAFGAEMAGIAMFFLAVPRVPI